MTNGKTNSEGTNMQNLDKLFDEMLEGVDLPCDADIAEETRRAKIRMNNKSANMRKAIKERSNTNWKKNLTEANRKKAKDPNWLEAKSKGGKKSSSKRIKTMAKNKGYIVTPIGEFLTVKYAWRAHCEKDLSTDKNPHNWFKKMCKDFPNDYYKKSCE